VQQVRAPTQRAIKQESEAALMGPLPDHASISVVIPTFNDVHRIGDALLSIVNQTLPPGEIVVCDDGSDDGTEEFVREFGVWRAGGVPVRYLRLPSRSGAAAARNAGVTAARGAWIASCDSDDVWVPNKLERQIAFIRSWSGSRRIALLGTYGYNMNDAKKIISRAVMGPTTEEEYDSLKHTGGLFYLIHSSTLFCRADFLAVGGYSDEYGTADDYPFFCQMAEQGLVINMPEPLVYYRKRAGSVQLESFWDLRREVMRLGVNQRRQVNGQAPIGRDEFVAQLASAPPWERFKRRKWLWGFYYYRSGATDIVNGRRARGAFKLALASILDRARLRSGIRGVARARLPQRHDSARNR
jgi:glycosyltransferase involved in cell wall biosynthesis